MKSIKHIGVICAMKAESDAVAAHIDGCRTITADGFQAVQGEICGITVTVVVSGIGIVNSAVACTVLHKLGADAVVNVGVAGGLTRDLSIGDIVIAEKTVYWDLEKGVLTGHFPYIEPEEFRSDADLVTALEKCATKTSGTVKICRGTVASGQKFIEERAVKNSIRENTGADCVEMEGAGCAHACHIMKLPFVVVRSISDCYEGNFMSYMEFLPLAAARAADIFAAMCKMLKE